MRTRSSADAEIARHTSRLNACRDCCPAEVQNSTFSLAKLVFHRSGSQDTTIRVGFGTHVAKTATYIVICRFPFFVLNQRYRQTDVMLVA